MSDTDKEEAMSAVVSVTTNEELDFIGSSHAVKDLFALPYSLDKGVSVAVHNMNGTLLIDADTVVDNPKRKRPRPSAPRDDATLAIVTSMLHLKDDERGEEHEGTEEEHNTLWNAEESSDGLHPPEHCTAILETPREYIPWNFHGLNLLVGSDALIFRHPEQDALAVRVAERSELRALFNKQQDMVRQGQFVPDSRRKSYADAAKQLEEKPKSYAAPDLSHVQLQTCIVPSSTTPLSSLLTTAGELSSSPVCTVLDVYLDNIMANVPQLALCLREKGFIQSVKLMKTHEIPSSLIHASTLDMSCSSSPEPIFSPQIMEMNASTLLRFLKANCSKDNSTYLLRREAGQTNVQLYDVSSISTTRQRKWIWWLAMMSYRFALRLAQLGDRRDYRARQRSLLQTSLELLEELNDMDGGAHETLCASVQEHLADTFLSPETHHMALTRQRYANVSVDALTKAQDHLTNGIHVLWPLLEKKQHAKDHHDATKKAVAVSGESSSDEDSDESVSLELQSISMQLFAMHHKLINVSLRLAEHHLQNYFSSSAMRALRSAARRIADAISVLRGSDDGPQLQRSLQCQYTWLWELCGHFARSFAADELWRDRGHACGDDVISVLRDAEAALKTIGRSKETFWTKFIASDAPVTERTNGSVSLHTVSAVVDLKGSDQGSDSPSTIIEVAKTFLDRQKQIQRDKRRVLVAACVSYSRAIGAMKESPSDHNLESARIYTLSGDGSGKTETQVEDDSSVLSMLRKRHGDGCNEIGKILLTEVRTSLNNPNTTDTLSVENIPAVAEVLLSSAQFWFQEGLEAFLECGDLCNIALLHCNLCQCCKLRANTNFASPSTERSGSHAESCLQEAAGHLQMAHEALGERDANPITWDMVSEELAATFLVLGVRRRQSLLGGGTTPIVMQAMRLSPGKERSIVDPMERALKIYVQLGNAHQAAAVNYQMALFYSKVWTCQRDEAKTREKLSKAFHHYGAAHAYFSRAPEGSEATFVILSLDMANLYAVVSGKECLSKALSRCLDTVTAFSFEAINAALERQEKGETDWFEKMSTLAESLEDRMFKLLTSLVKLEKESGDCDNTCRDMYRAGLTAKMAMKARGDEPGTPDFLSSFHELLVSMKDQQK